MSQAPFDRVRGDLDAIRHAIGLGLPFGRMDMLSNLWTAGCGLAIILVASFAPGAYRNFALVPLGLSVLGAIWCAIQARKQRAERPSIWREHKLAGLAVLILVPLAIGYKKLEIHLGVPREVAGAATVFFVGVGVLFIAIANRQRLYYLPGGIALMAFGLAIPLLAPVQVMIGAGICMMSGLAAALIQAWQLQQQARLHDAN